MADEFTPATGAAGQAASHGSGDTITRRETLALLGALSVASLTGCPTTGNSMGNDSNTNSSSSDPDCVLTPAATEGPYFVDELLNRSDIRSDPVSGAVKEGAALRLVLNVARVSSGGCSPVSGAQVDIWHCDALGLYSDEAANNTVGQKFLRGYQLTDDDGKVEFVTIFPGWYTGRTIHIHFKVRVDSTEFTSQLFFTQNAIAEVLARDPYSQKGSPDTTNARDGIYLSDTVLDLVAEGDGYTSTFNIGLAS